jgi:hypothetical protein
MFDIYTILWYLFLKRMVRSFCFNFAPYVFGLRPGRLYNYRTPERR